MDDLMKMIRNGEMPKSFYKNLAEDFTNEPPKNNRMRFEFDAPYKGELYSPECAYALTVTEYADVCEGETLTSQSVICENAAEIIRNSDIELENSSLAFIQDSLRERFDSLELFKLFCVEHGVEFTEQPLWVDEHSFNEYTGEHRGEYTPFAAIQNKSGDKKLMKLKITEEMWGINHRNGNRSVHKTDEKTFDCVVGALPPFERGRRCFSIDEVTESGITLSVHYENEKYNKSWTLEKGEGAFYRPMSMDGGYQYTFKVK